MLRILGFARLLLLAALLTGAGRPHGTVLIRSTTTGARIAIDEHEVGVIPMKLPVVLRAGQHSVKVTRPGYADYLDTFRLKPGQDLVLEIDLLATAAVLQVEANTVGAVVMIDGRPLGEAPFEGEVEPGTRTLEVRASGHAPFRETVELTAGEVTVLKATLVPMPESIGEGGPVAWYDRWYVWAGGAALLAGGVAAVVLATRGGDDGPADPDHLLRIEPVR